MLACVCDPGSLAIACDHSHLLARGMIAACLLQALCLVEMWQGHRAGRKARDGSGFKPLPRDSRV